MKKEKHIPDYKVPKNYFETFEDRLFTKIATKDFPKASGFSVSAEYFENLEDRVLKTIHFSEKKPRVIFLFPQKYFGYAAAIAACLIIWFAVFNHQTKKTTLDALQMAAIDSYINEGNLNMDLYDVTTFIDDNDINDINLEEQQFSEATLKSYILENMDEEPLIDE